MYDDIFVHSLTRGQGAVTPGVTLASGRLRGRSRELSGTCHAGESTGNLLPAAPAARPEGDVNPRPSDPTPTHARGQDDVSITRKLPQIIHYLPDDHPQLILFDGTLDESNPAETLPIHSSNWEDHFPKFSSRSELTSP